MAELLKNCFLAVKKRLVSSKRINILLVMKKAKTVNFANLGIQLIYVTNY